MQHIWFSVLLAVIFLKLGHFFFFETLVSSICGNYTLQLESNVLSNGSISHPTYIVFQHTTEVLYLSNWSGCI